MEQLNDWHLRPYIHTCIVTYTYIQKYVYIYIYLSVRVTVVCLTLLWMNKSDIFCRMDQTMYSYYLNQWAWCMYHCIESVCLYIVQLSYWDDDIVRCFMAVVIAGSFMRLLLTRLYYCVLVGWCKAFDMELWYLPEFVMKMKLFDRWHYETMQQD